MLILVQGARTSGKTTLLQAIREALKDHYKFGDIRSASASQSFDWRIEQMEAFPKEPERSSEFEDRLKRIKTLIGDEFMRDNLRIGTYEALLGMIRSLRELKTEKED